MHLEVLHPKINIVRNIIAYYYVLESDIKNGQRYTTFPTINPHLMFFKGCKPIYNEIDQQIHFDAKNGYHFELVMGLNKPIEVNLQGKVTEVCITFHPLTMAFFMENKTGLHESGTENLKPRFLEEFEQLQKQVFKVANTDQLVDLLDSYFLLYAQQSNHQKLIEAIHLVEKQVYQVKELAQYLQLSERQLHRLFQTHLGCSPKAFIQIVRFRQSVFTKLKSQNLNLTQLAYHHSYFDQSHFIRDYQRMTGNSPKKFYKKIGSLDHDILWQIDQ